MPARTKEGDVLQEMTGQINQTISDQMEPVVFGEAMSSANFTTNQAVRNATSKGDSDYGKVSTIMLAVKDQITSQSSQEKVTEKFSEFVLLLHNNRLDSLAQQLVDNLRKKRPSYKSPLEGATSDSGPSEAVTQSHSSEAVAQPYSTNLSVEDLYSWLLSKHLPPVDCVLIKAQNINGMAFKYVQEADWKSLGVSFGGLIILKRIMSEISAPSPVTSNGASTNGVQTNGVSTHRNGTSGRTLVKSHHYGHLCEQLRPCAASWEDIATGLGFKGHEIASIRAEPNRQATAPGSWMNGMIDRWSHWAPEDARGSKDFATLEALKTAVNKAGSSDIALNLTLES